MEIFIILINMKVSFKSSYKWLPSELILIFEGSITLPLMNILSHLLLKLWNNWNSFTFCCQRVNLFNIFLMRIFNDNWKCTIFWQILVGLWFFTFFTWHCYCNIFSHHSNQTFFLPSWLLSLIWLWTVWFFITKKFNQIIISINLPGCWAWQSINILIKSQSILHRPKLNVESHLFVKI